MVSGFRVGSAVSSPRASQAEGLASSDGRRLGRPSDPLELVMGLALGAMIRSDLLLRGDAVASFA